jgi:hypothetical protein
MGKARKPKKPRRDETREKRIEMEIVVDAYTEEERAMRWYYYLEDKLHFPFLTHCIHTRATSPLRLGDEVQVVGMAPEDECDREIFVETLCEPDWTLAVALSQLEVTQGDEETKRAVEDWHFWVEMGYEF